MILDEINEELELRKAVFSHLKLLTAHSPSGVAPSSTINSFEFRGRRISLIVQPGIRKLLGSSAALTIRTTFTPPSELPPYIDDTDTTE